MPVSCKRKSMKKSSKFSKKTRNNITQMSGGGSVEFSNDCKEWSTTQLRPYQLKAVESAMKFYKSPNNSNIPYQYNDNTIVMQLIPIGGNNVEFIMLRETGTFSYLRYISKTIQIKAESDITLVYYNGEPAVIKAGQSYEVQDHKPEIVLRIHKPNN